ncbi:hypothetical protein [Weissella cibaria]|uniref:hypothetical protein n=1 Tax=Weissella cibaria TaxID=137591 RepID=UPI001197BC2C|nr:hypothetical protein [Weissella cibaria]TVV31745.1 hypothetical protein FO434_05640 [Weissella cibaria]
MAGYSTTIRSDVEVSGIGELKQASAALKELAESARRLNGSNFSNMGGGFANVEAGAKKAAEANKLLANSAKTAAEAQKNASAAGTYTKQIGEINKLTEAYAKMESAAKKAEAAEKTRFSATQSNYQREREQSGTQNFSTPNYSETGKKLGSSFKEAVGMFSLGMLGANAVMGVFDGVKNMVSGGWETLNDRQRGQAMWATSISDAHGTSGSALTSQSSKANDQIMMTALKAGNNFDEANSFAKQIYSSDAGVYSGSLGKTNHMLKGIFNIQDANALNDREMEQFKTAVGNVGDTGKMSGTIAKSFNLLDGKITRSIRKEYEKETGHELGKNKQGGWDWASVSAEMAYRGIDNYGNSGGIAKASERYNSTLPGVIRSVKEGSKDYISQVMKTFGDEVAKGGGFSDVLGKISKAFTSKSLITNADQFASKLSGLANALGTGINEIAPYAKTFGSGFMSGVKGTFNIIKMGVDQLKSFGSAIGKMIPEGSQKHIMDAVQVAGKFAGVAATVAASMKVLKGGASLLGDAGKGIKGILTGITRSKTTGDSVFSRATSQFSAAVSRFAGASGVKNAAGMAGDSLPGGFSKDAKGKYHRANGQYASDAEIAQLETRTGRRALASEAEASAGVFGRLFSKGQELKGVAGIAGETGRLAKNAGLLSRMGGSLATTVGKAGMAVSASKLGTVVSGIGKAGKFLGKGMPLLNGLFAGIDVMSTMATTQKGSLARHKGVGSAVGNGVGATIGGALGSALGPFGTVAGAMAGGWLGGKAGSWIGGMFGGTKDDKPKQTVAQRNAEAVNKAQTAAQATMAKQDFASNMAAYGYDKKNANELYSQINKGTNSKSKAKQIAAARMQEAIDAGDAAAISKWQSKLNKQNGILPGQENVDNRPKRIKARQVSLSDDKGAKKAETNAKAVSKANKSVKAPKGTDWNKYALNAQKASQKADKEFKKSAKSIGKTKIAPKSDKKGFDKVNRDAKSGMNKATKTVKSGAKKTQKAGKDAFKFKTSKSGFNKLNRDAKSGMNKVNRTVKSGSKKVQRSGKNMFKFKSSKSGFNKLNSQARSGINKVARTVKSGVKKVQNAGKNVFKFKSSKSGFNQLNSTARSGMSRVARTVKSGATKIQNAAKNAFKFKAASSGFNQLNSQAKSGISRVTSTIKSGSSKWDSAIQSSLSKAASTMSSQFSKMASTASSKSSAIASSMAKIGTAASAAASKVNALQSAIDRLKSKTITITANVTGKGASKLATGTPGAKSAFASLIPRYAKGTTQGGHGGGLALVNDAKGANWREAFMLPNGLVGLFPNKRDLMMPLPTGTQVLNGDDTKKMFPRYASGTNGAKKAFGGGSMGNINITVNISGNASASDANAIGNTIGEKLMTILNPETI